MGCFGSRFAALILLVSATSSVQAGGLTIDVGRHFFNLGQVPNAVVIPIVVTGTDLVHGMDLSVQLGGTSTTVAPFGTAPPITYEGSEQYNQPTLGAGSPIISPSMWDANPNSWGDSTNGSEIPTIPGTPGYGTAHSEGTWFTGSVTFNSIATADGQINPNNGIVINLLVDLRGWGNSFEKWPLRLLTGPAGPTDFLDRTGNPVPVTIIDGSLVIGEPEPSSLVLGLLGGSGLALVAIRKRRRRAVPTAIQ